VVGVVGDVEGDDRGGRVGYVADRAGDLVGGPVVQHPAGDRWVAAAGQHDGDQRAGTGGLAGGEFGGGVGEPPVRAVGEFQRDAGVRGEPRVPEPGPCVSSRLKWTARSTAGCWLFAYRTAAATAWS
jgi:hypothetical protein